MSDDVDLHSIAKPGLAVDVVLFTIKDNDLCVGLISRQEDPYYGKFALPGRFVRYSEPIEETAKLALKLKGGIETDDLFLEQLYTFGQNLDRDTRIRTVTVVYYALVNAERIDFQKGNKLSWHSVYKLPDLAFDHKRIIDYAAKRLRSKIVRSNFSYSFLPREFTLTELQRVCEITLDQTLDKRNFRKKMKELGLLKELKQKRTGGAHRPAQLYSFAQQPERKGF